MHLGSFDHRQSEQLVQGRQYSSCHDAFLTAPNFANGVYNIAQQNSQYSNAQGPFTAYCDSNGGFGWALITKMSSTTSKFNYDNALWTNEFAFVFRERLSSFFILSITEPDDGLPRRAGQHRVQERLLLAIHPVTNYVFGMKIDGQSTINFVPTPFVAHRI